MKTETDEERTARQDELARLEASLAGKRPAQETREETAPPTHITEPAEPEPAAPANAEAKTETVQASEPGTEIEVHRPTPTLLPSEHEWAGIMQVAHGLEKAMLVPKDLRGRAPDIALVLLYGRDLGLRPTVALSRIHVIEGRPSLSAEVMAAMIRQAGHRIDLLCTECGMAADDDEARKTCATPATHGEVTTRGGCKVRGTRGDDGSSMVVTWTLFDARQAELVVLTDLGELVAPARTQKTRKDGSSYWTTTGTKDNWWHHPKAMLWARAVSQLGRMLFPDVLSGLSYTGEELGANVDEHGEVIDVEGFDVPPSERATAEEFDVTPMPEADRQAIRDRLGKLPEEQRKMAATTWTALIRQAKLVRLDDLRTGDAATVETLLAPLEAKAAAAAAAEPAEAEVVAEDGRCLHCALSGGQHEPGCPNGPGPAPDIAPEPQQVPDTPPDPTPEGAADVGPAGGETGECATCQTPVYREEGEHDWHHVDGAEVDAQHAIVPTPPPTYTRPVQDVAPGPLAEPPRQYPHARQEATAKEHVGKLSHVEVVRELETAGLPTHGVPKMLRARLIEHLYQRAIADGEPAS